MAEPTHALPEILESPDARAVPDSSPAPGLALSSAALALAACGGGGGTGGTVTGPTPTPVVQPNRAQAARFLDQASVGATKANIEQIAASGYAA